MQDGIGGKWTRSGQWIVSAECSGDGIGGCDEWRSWTSQFSAAGCVDEWRECDIDGAREWTCYGSDECDGDGARAGRDWRIINSRISAGGHII
jgi:hypothetical protein